MVAPLFFSLFPSEVCRLVLGFIHELQCTETYDTFLRECKYLSELRSIIQNDPNTSFPLRVAGLTLDDILRDYFNIINIVNDKRDSSMIGYGPSDLPFCRPGDAAALLKHFLFQPKRKPSVKHASTLCNFSNFTSSFVPAIISNQSQNRMISIPTSTNPRHITVVPRPIPVSVKLLTTGSFPTTQSADGLTSTINFLQTVSPRLKTPELNPPIHMTNSAIDTTAATTPTSVNNHASSSSRRKPSRVQKISSPASGVSNASLAKDSSLNFGRILCSVAANAETLADKINSNLAEMDIPGDVSNFVLHYNGLSDSDFDEIYDKLVEDYNEGTDIDVDKILALDSETTSSNQDLELPDPSEACSSVAPVSMIISNSNSDDGGENGLKRSSTNLEALRRKPRSARKSIPRKLIMPINEELTNLLSNLPTSPDVPAGNAESVPSTSIVGTTTLSRGSTQDYALNSPAAIQVVDLDQTPTKKLSDTPVCPVTGPSTLDLPESGPSMIQCSHKREIPSKPLSLSHFEPMLKERSSTSSTSATVADSMANVEPNARVSSRRTKGCSKFMCRPMFKRSGYYSEYIPSEAYPIISAQPRAVDESVPESGGIPMSAPNSVYISSSESEVMIVEPTNGAAQIVTETSATDPGISIGASVPVAGSTPSAEQSQPSDTMKSNEAPVEYKEYSTPLQQISCEESAKPAQTHYYMVPESAETPKVVLQTVSVSTTGALTGFPYQIVDLSGPKVGSSTHESAQERGSINLAKSRLLEPIRPLQPRVRGFDLQSYRSPHLKRSRPKRRRTSRSTVLKVTDQSSAERYRSFAERFPVLQPRPPLSQPSSAARQKFSQSFDSQQSTSTTPLRQPRLIIRAAKHKTESPASHREPSSQVQKHRNGSCSSTPSTSVNVKENVAPDSPRSATIRVPTSTAGGKKRKIDLSKMDIESILEKVYKRSEKKAGA